MKYNSNYQNKNNGQLLVLVLVFGAVFFVMISSFVGFIVTQNKVVNLRFEQNQATDIAEAGLNYYKWFLAHYPDDLTDGTGGPGPYVHVYDDPELGAIGEFSLDVTSTTYCGQVASIEVESTGNTYQNPAVESTVRARYTRPTVAEYSFITNGGVWYGDDRVISGPVHSNQGIRMDGSHNSFVGSGQTSWTCDGSFGCSPSQTVPGVFTSTANANPGLFSYPTSPFDFLGITIDLSEMKSRAQDATYGGIYYGPSGGYGYRVIFNGNGTVTIRRVTNTSNYRAYSAEEGYHYGERNVITSSSFVATRTIDPDCPLIFIEDKVWVEGTIAERATLAAANLSSGAQTNIVINNNVRYAPNTDAGLLAIAEDDVDVGLVVPNNMQADGIYIAQNGRFGRNHYQASDLGGSLSSYVMRGTLSRLGSVVSNGRVGTRWVNGSGNTISGFQNRITSFDQNQVDNPPPLTPQTSDVYTFSDWRQDG